MRVTGAMAGSLRRGRLVRAAWLALVMACAIAASGDSAKATPSSESTPTRGTDGARTRARRYLEVGHRGFPFAGAFIEKIRQFGLGNALEQRLVDERPAVMFATWATIRKELARASGGSGEILARLGGDGVYGFQNALARRILRVTYRDLDGAALGHVQLSQIAGQMVNVAKDAYPDLHELPAGGPGVWVVRLGGWGDSGSFRHLWEGSLLDLSDRIAPHIFNPHLARQVLQRMNAMVGWGLDTDVNRDAWQNSAPPGAVSWVRLAETVARKQAQQGSE